MYNYLLQKKVTMDSHFSKLPNSLIEICVVVGMDQDTGLKPASSPEVIQILFQLQSSPAIYMDSM